MKRYVKRIWAWMLCMALCMSGLMTVEAANSEGVKFSATLDSAEIQKTSVAQTLTLTLMSDRAITAGSMEFALVCRDAEEKVVPLELSALTAGDGQDTVDWQYNMQKDNTYRVGWFRTDAENVENITKLVSMTFIIPADMKAGSYTIGVESLEITKDYGTVWETETEARITAEFTVKEAEQETGYKAGISAEAYSVQVGETVYIPVTVSGTGDAETGFNAGELMVNYDSSVLMFDKEGSTLGSATVQEIFSEVGSTEKSATVKLADYGEIKEFGTTVYKLAFKAGKAVSGTKVILTDAGFTNKEAAAQSDLQTAALIPAAVTLSITEKALTVTIDRELFVGETSTAYGSNYTFKLPEDGAYYDYKEITATMAGKTVDVLNNNDGTYTVERVTGDLVISCAGRTAKSYDVAFKGDGAADMGSVDAAYKVDKAIYGTDYQFKIPTETDEYVYSLGGVTIAGKVYTGFLHDAEMDVYVISGDHVKGKVEITINRTKAEEKSYHVTADGAVGDTDVETKPTAKKGSTYTMTLTPEAGYVYEVSATMGGTGVELMEGTDGFKKTYTIAKVTGDIVFRIEKSIDTSGISVSQYLTLDKRKMWLVKDGMAVADGKIPTYNGEKMFWSGAYGNGGAYSYLVISEGTEAEVLAEAKKALGIADGTKESIAYDCDVNRTGKVDAGDAQLVWNMYNAEYADFETAGVIKFLEADVNKDGSVNVDDAAAVISRILKSE